MINASFKVLFECTYCGHQWTERLYDFNYAHIIEHKKCDKCADKNVKAKKLDKINTYPEVKKK